MGLGVTELFFEVGKQQWPCQSSCGDFKLRHVKHVRGGIGLGGSVCRSVAHWGMLPEGLQGRLTHSENNLQTPEMDWRDRGIARLGLHCTVPQPPHINQVSPRGGP